MCLRILLAILAMLTLVCTQMPPAAIIVIESSHSCLGEHLSNQTVTIPLTTTYVNRTTLRAVSALYLVDAQGVPLDSISCTPFVHESGVDSCGMTFDSTTPSLFSTNPVQIGSIVCITTWIESAPSLSLAAESSRIASLTSNISTRSQSTTSIYAAETSVGSASSSTIQIPESTGSGLSMNRLSGAVLGIFGICLTL